ncbi:MAG: response regulator [Peptostreptococcaceae bacterium]|nr:response regulator [Peptostreptococcaceae bacterium]
MIIKDACMNYPYIILLISPNDGSIIWANKKAEEIYGYSIKELRNMKINEINILRKEQIDAEMLIAKNENRNYFHFPHKTKSGEIVEMEVESYPTLVDEKNVLLSIIKLRKEGNYLNNAAVKFVEESNDAVIVVDQSMRIIKANNYFIDNYEDVNNNAIGKLICEALICITASECIACMNKLSNGEVVEVDTEIYNNKNEINYCGILGIPTFFRDKFFGAVISIRNKTEETLKEKEKVAFFEKALENEEAHRRAKEEFFARMSHDMRTPLNAIINMARFGIEEENSEIDIDYFKQINESSEYLLGLLNDLLSLKKLEESKIKLDIEAISTKEFLEGVLTIIRNKAESKGVTFKANLKNEICDYVKFDKQRVKQIEINILDNAIKFTDNGGEVVWNKEYLKDEEGRPYFHNEVIDNGIGIGDGFKELIFEPFMRERSASLKTDGTGLGLAVSKSLLNAMDGKIWLESEKGKGTTFYFDIPVMEATEEEIEYLLKEKKDIVVNYDLTDCKILICEDNNINAKILIKILEEKGAVTTWVIDGKSGVDMLRDNEYDIILMDIRMPILNGIDAAIRIRGFNKTIPIIALSANVYKADVKRSLDAGMNEHLGKPIDKDELLETICKYI